MSPSSQRQGRPRGRHIIQAKSRVAIAFGVSIALGGLAWTPAIGDGLLARSARLLQATDTAHLQKVRSPSEEILEVGRATGTLPGSVRAYLNVGPTVIAHFTIYTSSGSISGTGSGRLHGRPSEPSFSGRMNIRHGSGRYAHAHGEGGFYGTLNRKTYALVVQTTGTLSY